MDHERAVARIIRLTRGIIAGGALICFALEGWRLAAGFLLGGLASYLNFLWLKRTVDSLGGAAASKPPRASVAVFLGLRYLLLGLGGYAILKFSEISLNAALVGLFAPAAAVVLEILGELIDART